MVYQAGSPQLIGKARHDAIGHVEFQQPLQRDRRPPVRRAFTGQSQMIYDYTMIMLFFNDMLLLNVIKQCNV